MNDGAGNQEFVKASAARLVEHLSQPAPEVSAAIAKATGAQADAEIEQHRVQLLAEFTEVRDKASEELAQPYVHYASRVDIVGRYQSILAQLFNDVPGLQGYGDRNPVWITTLLEEGVFKLRGFFHEVFVLQGKDKSLLQALIEAWKDLKFLKAPYPAGLPATHPLDETSTIALLADWGGDNPAARNVANIVRNARPAMAIHLGDIYYGGVKAECETFLRNWPLQVDPEHPGSGVPPGSSRALNVPRSPGRRRSCARRRRAYVDGDKYRDAEGRVRHRRRPGRACPPGPGSTRLRLPEPPQARRLGPCG